MANIKGLDIFGNNKGLAKIKKEAEAKKKKQVTTSVENKQLETHQIQEIKTLSNIEKQSRARKKKWERQSESLIRFIPPSIL